MRYDTEYEEEMERQFGEENNEFSEDYPVTEQDMRDKAPQEYGDYYDDDYGGDLDTESSCDNCHNTEIGISRYRKGDFEGAFEAFQCLFTYTFRGTMYENGIGVERSYEKAFSYYGRSSKGYAEFHTGMMYLGGKGVSKSADHGIAYLEKASERGSPDAALALATMYELGTYVERDMRVSKGYYEKAFERFLPLAEKGRPYAERQVGLMYRDGKGVEQSDTQAKRWIELADSHKESWEQECLSRYLDSCGLAESSVSEKELKKCDLPVEWVKI